MATAAGFNFLGTGRTRVGRHQFTQRQTELALGQAMAYARAFHPDVYATLLEIKAGLPVEQDALDAVRVFMTEQFEQVAQQLGR